MPTKHPRHAVTETGAVAEALERLRAAVGPGGFTISELVVLGAERKLHAQRAREAADRKRLAALTDMVRTRSIPCDVELADEARRSGWVRRP